MDSSQASIYISATFHNSAYTACRLRRHNPESIHQHIYHEEAHMCRCHEPAGPYNVGCDRFPTPSHNISNQGLAR